MKDTAKHEFPSNNLNSGNQRIKKAPTCFTANDIEAIEDMIAGQIADLLWKQWLYNRAKTRSSLS